ncbi:hypothetical protein ACWDKQ_14755 [Saccharopolyspora sp. NPDC000995]
MVVAGPERTLPGRRAAGADLGLIKQSSTRTHRRDVDVPLVRSRHRRTLVSVVEPRNDRRISEVHQLGFGHAAAQVTEITDVDNPFSQER